jgi:endonuclease-3
MGTARATKAADKSQVCRKLVIALQKLYGRSVPKIDLSVVETLLFATCLEDNPWATAEASFKTLISSYFDLNEIRVSSVSELEQTLSPLKDASWKGLRVRSILRYVFETTYSYDFEKLRRQTLEQAVKTLKKINDLSPFIRDFVLHEILGSHVICLDNSMLTSATWLGLVPAKSDLHDASEFLKGGIKKAEVSEFCFLLRCLATDPKFIPRFADSPEIELTMDDVQDRLLELQSPPKRKSPKPASVPAPSAGPAANSTKKPAVVVSSEKAPAAKSAVSPRPKPAPAHSVAAAGKKPASKPAADLKSTAKKSDVVPPKSAAAKAAPAKTGSKKATSESDRSQVHGKPSSDRKGTPSAGKPSKK